jgi:hypothetical protein
LPMQDGARESMIPQPLNNDELALVGHDSEDIPILEVLKGMSIEELRSFDVYTPICMKHYARVQTRWISTEKSLLDWKSGRLVDESELIRDMQHTRNPERFRAYYVLKYPAFVSRIAAKIVSSMVPCDC